MKSKMLFTKTFSTQQIKVREVLELSSPQLSKTLLTLAQA